MSQQLQEDTSMPAAEEPAAIGTEDSQSPGPTDVPVPVIKDPITAAESTPDAPPAPDAPPTPDAPPAAPASTLPLLVLTDDLETTMAKMTALAAIVQEGKNLAEHTGFLGAVHTERDPKVVARNAMTPVQGELYDNWLACNGRVNLPKIDWAENRLPPLSGRHTERRNKDRATAMDVIWKNDGEVATAENVAWLVENHAPLMPLVEAVVRVIRVTRDVDGGGGSGLSGLEMADLQTCRKVISVCSLNMLRAQQELRRMEAKIRENCDLLNQRVKSLEVKYPALQSKSE